MSQLANWLKRQMDDRGWSFRDAHKETGVSSTAISNILNEGGIPKLETLSRFAERFQVPMWQLIEMCGYDAGVSRSPSLQGERIANLIQDMPELEPVLTRLTEVDPGSAEGILVYLEAVRRRGV